MTPESFQPFETESRDTILVEFDDEWKPLSPDEVRELRKRLPPPWTGEQPPTPPKPPAE